MYIFKSGLFLATVLLLSLAGSLSFAKGESCSGIFQVKPEIRSLIPLIKMDPQYIGESVGRYIDPVTKKPWNVKYFTPSDLAGFELKIQDGLFITSQGKKANSEFDSESMSFELGLIVIDKQRRILVLPYEQRGRFHHSSLSRGEVIVFAGMAAFSQGRIRELNDNSGHYKPSPQQTVVTLKLLKSLGVDLSQMKLGGKTAQILGKTYSMSPKEVEALLLNPSISQIVAH